MSRYLAGSVSFECVVSRHGRWPDWPREAATYPDLAAGAFAPICPDSVLNKLRGTRVPGLCKTRVARASAAPRLYRFELKTSRVLGQSVEGYCLPSRGNGEKSTWASIAIRVPGRMRYVDRGLAGKSEIVRSSRCTGLDRKGATKNSGVGQLSDDRAAAA